MLRHCPFFITFYHCYCFSAFTTNLALKKSCYIVVVNFLKKHPLVHRIIGLIYDKKIDICGGVIVL